MFIGHYGVAFASKRVAPAVPLWVTFLAVQLLDVIWAPLVLLGVEKVRIVPGITASNPLDLYYMPYTHSLVAALLWSAIAVALYLPRSRVNKPALIVGAAVFSHWVLDFLVHTPDLPLLDNTAKVGLGLWNYPAPAFALEAALLFGGMWLYVKTGSARRLPTVILGIVMVVVQAVVFFGPPPSSDKAAAVTALVAYVLYAVAAAWLEKMREAHLVHARVSTA
jgi:membrane-bound metal-dependent hydrolase YbcI (DUF457 family)